MQKTQEEVNSESYQDGASSCLCDVGSELASGPSLVKS